jgi:hypothetical protein
MLRLAFHASALLPALSDCITEETARLWIFQKNALIMH